MAHFQPLLINSRPLIIAPSLTCLGIQETLKPLPYSLGSISSRGSVLLGSICTGSSPTGSTSTGFISLGAFSLGFLSSGILGSRFLSLGFTIISLRHRRRRRAGRAGMAVAGMLGEAVKGAFREAFATPGVRPVQRAVILCTLLAIIVREVFGTLMLVKYGAYAFWLYASLSPWKQSRRSDDETVVVARNVRYGPSQRNLLDVYVPCKQKVVVQGLKPVVVFVHGGVWASGDKWQFSPLGSFLAEEGIVAVLVQYTLYPEALAIDQVGEVSQALSWAMDNIVQYGGDPNRIVLMGHSSGAHLAALALWERAASIVERAAAPASLQQPPPVLDVRIPRGFVGLAGVYNIGEHFKHEMGRGVGAISCMRPACGWEGRFDSMSPSLLFEGLLLRGGVKFVAARGKKEETEPSTSDESETELRGVDLVPRCLLLASHDDIVVPPASSVALNDILQTLGCHSRVVLHDDLKHEDFVLLHLGWGSLKSHLGLYLEELLKFVKAADS